MFRLTVGVVRIDFGMPKSILTIFLIFTIRTIKPFYITLFELGYDIYGPKTDSGIYHLSLKIHVSNLHCES